MSLLTWQISKLMLSFKQCIKKTGRDVQNQQCSYRKNNTELVEIDQANVVAFVNKYIVPMNFRISIKTNN